MYDGQEFSFFIPELVNYYGDGHEAYEKAKVMACCGEYDHEEELFKVQPAVAENCLLDFRQQACRSMAHGLATLINDGTIPLVYKNRAKEIQNWIATRTSECVKGLVDTDDSPDMLKATWNLPNNGPWAPELSGVYVRVDGAYISGVYAPATGPDICESLHDNNDEFFTDQSAPPFINSYAIELEEADGDLLGPLYDGAPISGAADFASLSTSCAAPYCSTASLSEDGTGAWAIDSMVLHVDGSLVVSNGTLNENVTDGRIELYKQARGTLTCERSICSYTIAAGDAHFLVVGSSDGEVASLPLSNSTAIKAMLMVDGSWEFAPFEIEYVDDLSNRWTLTVNASNWL